MRPAKVIVSAILLPKGRDRIAMTSSAAKIRLRRYPVRSLTTLRDANVVNAFDADSNGKSRSFASSPADKIGDEIRSSMARSAAEPERNLVRPRQIRSCGLFLEMPWINDPIPALHRSNSYPDDGLDVPHSLCLRLCLLQTTKM